MLGDECSVRRRSDGRIVITRPEGPDIEIESATFEDGGYVTFAGDGDAARGDTAVDSIGYSLPGEGTSRAARRRRARRIAAGGMAAGREAAAVDAVLDAAAHCSTYVSSAAPPPTHINNFVTNERLFIDLGGSGGRQVALADADLDAYGWIDETDMTGRGVGTADSTSTELRCEDFRGYELRTPVRRTLSAFVPLCAANSSRFAEFWRVPLRLRPLLAGRRGERIRRLLNAAGHARADLIFANRPLRLAFARLCWRRARKEGRHLFGRCTYCMLPTSSWCDGILGWTCGRPLCTDCDNTFRSCSGCVHWNGIPVAYSPWASYPPPQVHA